MSPLKPLIGKLNPTCKRALETAAQLCLTQTHLAVEVQHLLVKLAVVPDSDLSRLLRHYGVDAGQVAADLTRALDRLPRGNTQTPAFSELLLRLLERAWVVSSLRLGGSAIRSGAILAALLDDESLRGMAVEAVPALARIPRGSLLEELPTLLRGGSEDATAPLGPAPGGPGAAASKSPALDAYTIDLTAQARAGRIDPIVGRDAEIRQVIDILMRRRQNNPILTGDPGVGKTAVVEGFARQVVEGAVPPPLRGVAVRALDLGLLQAGAGIKGEFESRLKQVIEEVAAAIPPVILFIDEAHTLVGAGGPAGQGDAANLLKPALARGELRTIAATTWGEYKRHIEKDPALARRFQVVKVAEPDEPTAVAMLRALVPALEAHHGVRILDDAVADAVRLSHRYISDRQLPDKAVGVLDTACARVALAQTAPPPALQTAARKAAELSAEIALLARESAAGRDHTERMERLSDERAAVEENRHRLEARWTQEAETVGRIRVLEEDLAELNGAAYLRARAELDGLRLELELVQEDEAPLVPVAVDHRAVAAVVAGWTGIPVGRMLTDNVEAVRSLRGRMGERVVGQDAALDAVARRIRTYFAGLGEPGKPTGVFLLVGPSGVGKTETALTLAELLFGGERSLITINMSEYQEAHSVSGLKGAPPGYVGFGKGGVLTEAVRRSPYAVVLLDEVEKAHPDVLELFYQVFDKGTLEDSEGVVVDFKNTIILLTSNLGTETIERLADQTRETLTADPLTADRVAEAIRPELVRRFKPALLGRMVVVPYLPLDRARIHAIVRLKLARVQARVAEAHGAELTWSDAVIAHIAERCAATDAGARAIDHLLTNTLLPDLSGGVLDRLADGLPVDLVHVDLDGAGALRYSFGLPATAHGLIGGPR